MGPKRESHTISFLVGIEAFSRYAFVSLYRDTDIEEKKPDLEDLPKADAEAVEESMVNGKAKTAKAEAVKRIFQDEWFPWIKDKGYDLLNICTDVGGEFKGSVQSLYNENIFHHPIRHVITVPNDDIANPIAERFIQTFKRLFGQYTLGWSYPQLVKFNQDNVNEIVNFYNERIHSSTHYAPKEVLDDGVRDEQYEGDDQKPSLFDFYLHQKAYDLDTNLINADNKNKLQVGQLVRLYAKWKTTDANIGDKKSNNPNWSFTLFRIAKFDKKQNQYELDIVDKDLKKIDWSRQNMDDRDKNIYLPFTRKPLFRIENLLVVDEDAYKKYVMPYLTS